MKKNLSRTPGCYYLSTVAIISLVISFVSLSIILFLKEYLGSDDFAGFIYPFTNTYMMWTIGLITYSVFVSIVTLTFCNDLSKSRFLLYMGIASIFLLTIDTMLAVPKIGVNYLITLPIDIALPVLYIIGAKKNLDAYIKQTNSNEVCTT